MEADYRQPKRLNEMDDLRDMGRFPVPIYVGATGNILATLVLTYMVQGRYKEHYALPVWALTIISCNLLPVVALRSQMDETTHYPLIEEMDFVADQHKFSTWVYAIASANMLVWILLAWTIWSYRRSPGTLVGMLGVAFVCTFFPAWMRLFRFEEAGTSVPKRSEIW
ncbi:MAG: hypothetical protein H0X37_10500 [Herpetosiphonaceae bacterium]|nr:hypothetical protein [Herpetosiphonaceae bacterium]